MKEVVRRREGNGEGGRERGKGGERKGMTGERRKEEKREILLLYNLFSFLGK